MKWDLPVSVEIDGKEYYIRNKCDYRVVLDAICALNDEELELKYRMQCALFIFYEDLLSIENIEKATFEMLKIINLGEEIKEEEHKPRFMDWEHDFAQIAPPISRVLGYSVRDKNQYTHWYDFVGAYVEIGSDCLFANIISIRNKRMKGKKLEKWEQEFYKENRKMIDLPLNLTGDDKEWLDSDW